MNGYSEMLALSMELPPLPSNPSSWRPPGWNPGQPAGGSCCWRRVVSRDVARIPKSCPWHCPRQICGNKWSCVVHKFSWEKPMGKPMGENHGRISRENHGMKNLECSEYGYFNWIFQLDVTSWNGNFGISSRFDHVAHVMGIPLAI